MVYVSKLTIDWNTRALAAHAADLARFCKDEPLLTRLRVNVELGLDDSAIRGLEDALLVGVVVVDVDGLDFVASF